MATRVYHLLLMAFLAGNLALMTALPSSRCDAGEKQSEREKQIERAHMLASKRDQPRRFTFKIDPGTPVKDLLPTAPKLRGKMQLDDSALDVPEVALGDFILDDPRRPDFEEAAAHYIAKINHVNKPDPDGFLKALMAHRPDLRGLPFMTGEDCRMEKKQAQLFAETVPILDQQLKTIALREPEAASVPNAQYTMELIWGDFPKVLADKGDAKSKRSQASKAELDRAAMIGLTQMLAIRPALYRVGYAKHLSTLEDADAAQTLARLALFAPEEPVRNAAIASLKDRPTRDYVKVLIQGFRYPLPAVNKRAAEALVKLQCKDVVADLVNVLEKPDPRAPQKQKVDGEDTTAVREVVRINHHRNCLLCHAPANTGGVPPGVLTVPVTLPERSFQGYQDSRMSPDIFVRIDMTYLRQDFSMMNGKERFDFIVRTRALTPMEATERTQELAKEGTPPSHAAAQYALRGLTGQAPAGATPETWRRLLNLR